MIGTPPATAWLSSAHCHGEKRQEEAQMSHSTQHVCHTHNIWANNKRDPGWAGRVGSWAGQGGWRSSPTGGFGTKSKESG